MSDACVCSFSLLRELRTISLIWSIIEFGPWACHALLRNGSRWEGDEKQWQGKKDRRRDGRARRGVGKEEVAYGWKMRKYTGRRKGRCSRRGLRGDAALHSQSSVRLHKYCAWASGWQSSQYDIWILQKPFSPLLPSSIINVQLRVGSTFPETFLSAAPAKTNEKQTDGHFFPC